MLHIFSLKYLFFNLLGVPHGHTGHVRFLTSVQVEKAAASVEHSTSQKASGGVGCRTLVISGGDGYEDFRSSSLSEIAGREDSTNHLLLWRVWTESKNSAHQKTRNKWTYASLISPPLWKTDWSISCLKLISEFIYTLQHTLFSLKVKASAKKT